MIKVVSAGISENGTVNGQKGDQTKREVRVRPRYNFGQDTIIRFRHSKRKKASSIAIKLANNDRIGYGQSNRTTLWDECIKIGWDAKKIHKIDYCNCDCSMLIICIINLTYGKKVIGVGYTGNLETLCKKHKDKFTILKIPYLEESNLLKLADIELKAYKHVTIICERRL